MPVKLREFYWNELIASKDAEAKVYENATKQASKSSRAKRK